MDITGSPISSSGATRSLPSSSLPIETTVTANHFFPRISSGMSGIGGRFSIRTMLPTSSGTCAHQSR